MGNGCSNTVWREVARVFRDGTLTGLTDRQLLERFVNSPDEWAFDLLLTRHGPMVKHVCRQILRNPDDVEDAFQAVFLVLVRKAGSIRVEDSLGPWLYAVAGRTAAHIAAIAAAAATWNGPGPTLPNRPGSQTPPHSTPPG